MPIMKVAVFLAVVGVTLGGPTQLKYFNYTLNHIDVGNYSSSTRVVGGEDSLPGEFPWQISLQILPINGPKYHTCGGTIIDEIHIVCAAHCVLDRPLSELEVVAGAHNIKDTTEPTVQRLRVKRYVLHPEYNDDTIVNDISVLTLATPLDLSGDRAKPLRVSPANHEASGDCINTGWGNSNPNGSPVITPDALQKVMLSIVDREICANNYASINPVHESMICAGNPAKGSCSGDSGGQLVCFDLGDNRPYLAGVVSWGQIPCGQERFPTVFANVGYLRAFIDAEVSRP